MYNISSGVFGTCSHTIFWATHCHAKCSRIWLASIRFDKNTYDGHNGGSEKKFYCMWHHLFFPTVLLMDKNIDECFVTKIASILRTVKLLLQPNPEIYINLMLDRNIPIFDPFCYFLYDNIFVNIKAFKAHRSINWPRFLADSLKFGWTIRKHIWKWIFMKLINLWFRKISSKTLKKTQILQINRAILFHHDIFQQNFWYKII